MRKIIKGFGVLTLCQSLLFISIASRIDAASIAEVTAKVGTLNPQDKQNFLVKGAQKEGELVYYGTILVN
ncbi:MAG TPA: hypothetical protein VF353_08665 [Candidatus Binatia bacterium]